MAIGWAIVSTGRHPDAKLAPGVKTARDTRLVAIYSRDRERAEAFAQRHGALAAYDSYEDLLRDPRVDVVCIASPNHLHAPQTIQAAQAGKHILVEKPMALTVEEALEMVRVCRARGVGLGVGFRMRHHPGVGEACRIIQDGTLGTIALAQAQWASGVRGRVYPPPRKGLQEWWDHPEMVGAGSMMGTGVHCVDLLRYLLGQEVVEVAALTDGQTEERPLEQLGTILLRFSDGAIGMVCCSRRLPDSRNDAVIYGSLGRLTLARFLSTILQGQLEVVSDTVNTTTSYPTDEVGMYTRQVEAFNEAIQKGEEPSASGVDGLRVVQVTVAFVESARTGRRVRLEPLAV